MRVVIVADNSLSAEAIRRLVRHAPDCRVLGYADGREPVDATLAESGPDVVLVDEMNHARTALDRVREARFALPNAKVVLLTLHMDQQWLGEAATAGIDAAIAKNVNPLSLCTLLREVVAGNIFHAFTPTPAAVQPAGSAGGDLTPRELEILRLVAAGKRNGHIAAELWVAEQTVKFHLSNIYRKLGVANRTEASHYAHVNGLLDPISRPAALPIAA